VGWVYIFVKTRATGVCRLPSRSRINGLGFGSPVAINGGTVVVGDSGAAGAVYVYTQTGNTWSQQARLTAADGVSGTISAPAWPWRVAPSWWCARQKQSHWSAYIFTQTGGT